jgi:hypothetical protein
MYAATPSSYSPAKETALHESKSNVNDIETRRVFIGPSPCCRCGRCSSAFYLMRNVHDNKPTGKPLGACFAFLTILPRTVASSSRRASTILTTLDMGASSLMAHLDCCGFLRPRRKAKPILTGLSDGALIAAVQRPKGARLRIAATGRTTLHLGFLSVFLPNECFLGP